MLLFCVSTHAPQGGENSCNVPARYPSTIGIIPQLGYVVNTKSVFKS